MKNSYCKLSSEQIKKLPERFLGFMLSPFQHNLRNEMVHVPEDTFQEMIDIIAEYALQVAAATPPSPSTAPEREYDPMTPLEAAALVGELERHRALASRPAEVDESPKPPRTPEEMVAFIGSHFDAMRDETSDPEDIRFTLSVHDLLSAMSDWFDDYAESAYSNEKAAEVDDEGLPPLPATRKIGQNHLGFIYGYDAEQYRQGQRDAVAADRARREKGGA